MVLRRKYQEDSLGEIVTIRSFWEEKLQKKDWRKNFEWNNVKGSHNFGKTVSKSMTLSNSVKELK